MTLFYLGSFPLYVSVYVYTWVYACESEPRKDTDIRSLESHTAVRTVWILESNCGTSGRAASALDQ